MTYQTEFLLPELGDGDGGRIVSWLKQPGDTFAADEPVLEVETDKAVIEVPAPCAGKLVGLLVDVDDLVEVNDPIATIEREGEAPEQNTSTVDPGEDDSATHADIVSAGDDIERSRQGSEEQARAPASGAGDLDRDGDGRILASPYARKLAGEAGLTLASVKGSGVGGRIVAGDIRRSAGTAGAALSGGSSAGPVNVGQRIIDTGNGSIFVKSWEPRDGNAHSMMILLHGLFADVEGWASTATLLARAGIRVFAVDLPNHGQSASHITGFPGVVDTVAESLEPLIDGPWALVGHSYGAAVAARIAAREGTRPHALGLISPLGLDTHAASDFMDGMTRAGSIEALRRELRKLTVNDMVPGDEFLRAIHRQLSPRAERLDAMWRDVASDGIQQIAIHEDLKKLDMPRMIVHGRQDRIIPWRGVLEAPSAVALHLPAQVGHMPHWESSKLTVDLVSQLTRHAR